jgi:copper chaperone CopZ
MKIATIFLGLCLSASALAAKIEVDVAGMTCGMCIEAITKELNATAKAENVVVSLETKKATFSEIKGKNISDSEVRNAIKKAGYEAVKVVRK